MMFRLMQEDMWSAFSLRVPGAAVPAVFIGPPSWDVVQRSHLPSRLVMYRTSPIGTSRVGRAAGGCDDLSLSLHHRSIELPSTASNTDFFSSTTGRDSSFLTYCCLLTDHNPYRWDHGFDLITLAIRCQCREDIQT